MNYSDEKQVKAHLGAVQAEREAFNRWYDSEHGVLTSTSTRQDHERHTRRLHLTWEAWKARARLGGVYGQPTDPKNSVATPPRPKFGAS